MKIQNTHTRRGDVAEEWSSLCMPSSANTWAKLPHTLKVNITVSGWEPESLFVQKPADIKPSSVAKGFLLHYHDKWLPTYSVTGVGNSKACPPTPVD